MKLKYLICIALSILLINVVYADLDDDVIGSWNFNSDGNLTTDHYGVLDFSDRHFHGVNASVSTSTTAIINTSLYFDGSSYVSMGDVYNITTEPVSVCAMARASSFSNNNAIIGAENTPTFNMRQYSNAYMVGDNGGFYYNCPALSTNTWYGVCNVIKCSSGFDCLEIWIDGSNITSTCTSLGTWNGFDDGDNLSIGAFARPTGAESYFTGYIDEVIVWNRSLNGSEVNGWYTNVTNGNGYPFAGEPPAPPENVTYNNITFAVNDTTVKGDPFNVSITTALNGTCKYNTIQTWDFDTEGTLLAGNETEHYWNLTTSPGTNYSFYYKCNQSNGTVTNSTLQFLVGGYDYDNEFSCYGDSITVGAGYYPYCAGMTDYLVNESGYTGMIMDNQGRGGTCLADYPACANPNKFIDIYQDMVKNNSRFLLIQPNVNDNYYYNDNGTRYKDNLSTILSYLTANMDNTTIIMATQIAFTDAGHADDINLFNGFIREMAIRYNVPLVEMTYAMNFSSTYMSGDQLHIDQDGHDFYNETMMPAVLNPSDYIMPPDKFNIYHGCNDRLKIMNWSIESDDINCVQTTSNEWIVIENITTAGFYITRADESFQMNVTDRYQPNQQYIINDNGSLTNVTSNSNGDLLYLNFSSGNKRTVTITLDVTNYVRIDIDSENKVLQGVANFTQANGNDVGFEYTWYRNGENISYGFKEGGTVFYETPNSTLITDVWDSTYPATNLYDGNYSTFGVTNLTIGNGTLFANYTLPAKSISLIDNFTWGVKVVGQNHVFEIDPTTSCLVGNIFVTRLTSYTFASNNFHSMGWCLNGSSYYRFFDNAGATLGYRAIYEENVTMHYNYTPHSSGQEHSINNYTVSDLGTYVFSVRTWNGTHYSDWVNSSSIGVPEINVSIYDEQTGLLINQTTTIRFIVDSITNATEYVYNITGNGIIDNLSINNYNLFFETDNYTKRHYYISIDELELNYTLNLFLLKDTVGSFSIIKVIDQNLNPIEGAVIKVLKDIPNFDNKQIMSILRTSFEGEATLDFKLNTDNYQFQIFINDVLVKETIETQISKEIIKIQVPLLTDFYEGMKIYTDARAEIYFTDGTTSNKTCNYFYVSSNILEACVKLYERSLSENDELICQACSSALTGLLTCDFNITGRNLYLCQGWMETNSTNSPVIVAQNTYSHWRGVNILGRLGILVGFIIIIGLAFLFRESPAVMIFMSLLGLIFVAFAGYISIPYGGLLLIILVGAFFMFKIKG